MRIAIPLQGLRYQGGIATYIQELVARMVEMDQTNHYILIYPAFENAREDYGRYSHVRHVTEVLAGALVPIGHYWTQAVVPGVARRNRADIVFNPWLSIPLYGRYKKVFVMHNCEWYNMPEVFWFTERLWGRSRMTAYMKAADIVISVSQKVADVLSDVTGLPPSKFRVIFNAAGDQFRPIDDPEELGRVKQKYSLVDDFLLFVGGIYPQKNFGTLLRAFHGVAKDIPHRLVVAGSARWSTSDDMQLVKELRLEDRIDFLGWVGHDDLPALYNLATCFLIPSLFESCSVALLEAMSCGCPVIGANTGGNPEVVQDAAILLDPMDTSELEREIRRVIADPALRADLANRGLRRAADFGWDKSAARTLALLRELYESG